MTSAPLAPPARAPRPRTLIAAVTTLVVLVTAGCALAPPPAPTVDDAIAERRALVEAAERERFDAFVTSSSARIAELGVPVPEFQGVVARDAWPDAVAACIDEADPRIRADRPDDRLTVSYFGMVGDEFDRSRWAIESCTAQFGAVDPRRVGPAGPVEQAWRYDDARGRLLPCLRAAGLSAPPLPDVESFIATLGGGDEWNPYALVAIDPAALQRAVALCPPSTAVLEQRAAQRGAP